MSTEKEGWALPPTQKRFHYFRNGGSLCGRYDESMSEPAMFNPEPELCCRECFKRKMREQ